MLRALRISLPATLAVLLSSALVCLVGITRASVNAGLQDAVRTATQGAAVIVSPSPGKSLITPEQLRRIAGEPGVTRADGQLMSVVTAETLNGTPLAAQSTTGKDTLTLEQGRLPSSSTEAVLATSTSKPVNLGLGSMVGISGADGGKYILTIVGIVSGPLGSTGNTSLPTIFGTLQAVQQWTGQRGFTRVLVHTDEPVGPLLTKLPEDSSLRGLRIVPGSIFATQHASDYSPGSRTLNRAMLLLVVVALMAAFVVITNTYAVRTAQDSRMLALLRCVGATRRQVFLMTLVDGLAAGILGSVLGVAFTSAFAGVLLPRIPGGATLHLVGAVPEKLLALATGVLLTVVATVRPGLAATRVSPLEGLRPATPRPGARASRVRLTLGLGAVVAGFVLIAVGSSFHEVAATVAGGVVSVAGVIGLAPILFPAATGLLAKAVGSRAKLAAGNLRRNPARTGATAVAVWFGAALITAVMVGAATASSTLLRAVDESTPADVVVIAPEIAKVQSRLGSVAQIQSSAIVRSTMVDSTVNGRNQLITVVEWTPELPKVLRNPSGAPSPQVGTAQLPPSSSTPAGSQLVLAPQKSKLALRVVTVSEAPGVGIVNPADYRTLGQSTQPNLWIKLRPGSDKQATVASISSLAGPGANVSGPGIRRTQITDKLQAATTTTVALLGVVIVIAVVGVANTLYLSVVERTREIGLMRALGTLRRQVRGLIVSESLLTTAAAALLGVAFGVAYGLGGMWTVLSGEQLSVVPTVPWLLLAAVLASSVPCAVLAALLPANRAAAVTPIAALSVPGE